MYKLKGLNEEMSEQIEAMKREKKSLEGLIFVTYVIRKKVFQNYARLKASQSKKLRLRLTAM